MFIDADNFTVFIFPSFDAFERDRFASPIFFLDWSSKRKCQTFYWNRTAAHEDNIEGHEGLI